MKIHCFSVIFGAVLFNCAAPFPSANAMVEVHVLGFVSFIFHLPKRFCRWQELSGSLVPSSSLPALPARDWQKLCWFSWQLSVPAPSPALLLFLHLLLVSVGCWGSESLSQLPWEVTFQCRSSVAPIPWLSGAEWIRGSGFGSSSGSAQPTGLSS